MAGVKISALPAGAVPSAADLLVAAQGGQTVQVTASQVRRYIGEGLSGASTANQTGFAADTYLTGSAITVSAAGLWLQGTMLRWAFDMVKTAAGTAAPVITVRMGTLGTTGDAAVYTFTFGVGTAAVDTGIFNVDLLFRSVGAGTAAVVAGAARCARHLAAAGITTTGGNVGIILPGASAGFDSTTQTIIGLSFNGGASFSGTNTIVTADADRA